MGWMASGKQALMTVLLRAIERIDLFSPATSHADYSITEHRFTSISGEIHFMKIAGGRES
jgi:hypothetical protein